MADSPTPTEPAPPARPDWVKVFLIILAVVIVLFIVLHLTGHGPTHQMPGGQ
jgi:hypothetical protein